MVHFVIDATLRLFAKKQVTLINKCSLSLDVDALGALASHQTQGLVPSFTVTYRVLSGVAPDDLKRIMQELDCNSSFCVVFLSDGKQDVKLLLDYRQPSLTVHFRGSLAIHVFVPGTVTTHDLVFSPDVFTSMTSAQTNAYLREQNLRSYTQKMIGGLTTPCPPLHPPPPPKALCPIPTRPRVRDTRVSKGLFQGPSFHLTKNFARIRHAPNNLDKSNAPRFRKKPLTIANDKSSLSSLSEKISFNDSRYHIEFCSRFDSLRAIQIFLDTRQRSKVGPSWGWSTSIAFNIRNERL